jgi:hypothetical protein
LVIDNAWVSNDEFKRKIATKDKLVLEVHNVFDVAIDISWIFGDIFRNENCHKK